MNVMNTVQYLFYFIGYFYRKENQNCLSLSRLDAQWNSKRWYQMATMEFSSQDLLVRCTVCICTLLLRPRERK